MYGLIEVDGSTTTEIMLSLALYEKLMLGIDVEQDFEGLLVVVWKHRRKVANCRH